MSNANSKTVLITGATGVVGSALVPEFLKEPETSVILLIRAESPAHLQQRMERLIAYWGDDIDSSAASRITALSGDVCESQLGLDDSRYRQLCETLTHVIHCAGNVKMNMSKEEATAISIDSAKHILALTQASQRAEKPCKLDHVSTLGVAGKQLGLVPEQMLAASRQFHNTYESSKAEAETLVMAAIDAGLPATLHRPSMVVGDSRSGKIIHFQVFYYLAEFLSGQRTYGAIPNAGEVKLDLIPSDYVARALHWSSHQETTNGKILHLCSGPNKAININHLAALIRQAFSSHRRSLPQLRVAPAWLFRALLPVLKLIAPKKLQPSIGNLPLFLNYLDYPQQFDNQVSEPMLASGGIPLPNIESYLPNVMEFYLKQVKQKRESK